MTRRATAQDVADLAGVSRSAVSLVLNGRAEGNISAVKQEAVREAARQLRYTPNAVALSLRSKRTATIGVLTWRNRWHMPPVLLGELYTAASSAGYLLMTVDAVQRPLQVEPGQDLPQRDEDLLREVPPLFRVPQKPRGEMAHRRLVSPHDHRERLPVSPRRGSDGLQQARILIPWGHGQGRIGRRIAVITHGTYRQAVKR